MTDDLEQGLNEARNEARAVLSELFVDRELDARELAVLSERLRATRLSIAEIERIYFDEVAPVLHLNLQTPAGEWSGFDQTWLQQEIEKRARRPALLPRALRRRWVTRTTNGDFARVRDALRQR